MRRLKVYYIRFSTIIRVNNNLGTLFLCEERLEDAIKCFEEQLELAEATKDVRGLGYGLSSMGYCYAKLNQIEKSENYTKRAKEISDKINDENIQFVIFLTNGLINKYYKNWHKAIDYFNRSITIIKELNEPIFLGILLIDFGSLYENKGDLDNAKIYYQQAYDIYRKIGVTIPKQLVTKL